MTPRPFLFRLIVPFALLIVLTVVLGAAAIYFAGMRTLHAEQLNELSRLARLASSAS